LAADRGPPGGWGPSHGTTGTMDNAALDRRTDEDKNSEKIAGESAKFRSLMSTKQ